MQILGISCWYHDSAVAFIKDGIVKCAVQEERFTRKKHDPNFPINSILWILEKYKLDINEFDYIAFYEDPNLKYKRINPIMVIQVNLQCLQILQESCHQMKGYDHWI